MLQSLSSLLRLRKGIFFVCFFSPLGPISLPLPFLPRLAGTESVWKLAKVIIKNPPSTPALKASKSLCGEWPPHRWTKEVLRGVSPPAKLVSLWFEFLQETPISSIVSHSWKTLNIFVFSTTVHKNSLFSFLPYLDIRSQQTNIFYQRDQLFTMTRIKILLPHLSPLAANNDLMAIIKKSSDYPLPHPPWRQITTSSR